MKRTATLLSNRGVVNQFMGDIASAMNDYQMALKLDHTHILAHFNVGNVLFHQRLFGQAVTHYSMALTHSPSPDDSILVNRGIAYSMLKEVERAEGDFRCALEVNCYSAHAHFNRGNLYKSLGRYDEAEQDYKRGI